MNQLVISAPYNTLTGYGEMARQTIIGLAKRGWDIYLDEITDWSSREPIKVDTVASTVIQALERKKAPEDIPHLIIATPDHILKHKDVKGPKYLYSAFEADKISHAWTGLCKFADKVFVISDFSKEAFVKGGVPDENLRVLPLGIDSNVFKPDASKRSKNEFVFGAGMTCIHRKGPDLLFEAFFNAFKRIRPDLPEPKLKIKVSEEGTVMSDNLTIQDFINSAAKKTGARQRLIDSIEIERAYLTDEGIAGFLNSCNAFVSLHRAEGFGLWPIQAMACGLPVIATEYGGNLTFMDRDNSLLVPVQYLERVENMSRFCCYTRSMTWAHPNIDMATTMMRGLHHTPEVFDDVGRKAREDVVAKFSWRNTIDKLEVALDE